MSKNFINLVKLERELDNNVIEIISDGRIFTGKSAVSLGLVDGIGNIKEAKDYLNTQYDLKELPLLDIEIIKEETFAEQFFSHFSKSFDTKKIFNLKGLISIWLPKI